jgi:outer membrane lipoprotein-sorting protein
MWHRLLLLPLLMLATSASAKAAKAVEIDAERIVNEAEKIRTLDQVSSKVEVESKNGKSVTKYQMDVLQASGRRAYLLFTAPDLEIDRRMLAIKTRYWSKFPNSKRVIPISRREAIGNSAFAIADVFQMDTKEDYNVKIIGEELLDKQTVVKLQLDGKHNDAPYFRIHYYVRKSDNYPLKAEFYGASKQKLKTMTVLKSETLLGRMRPKELLMEDNITANRNSIWRTLSIKQADVPDAVFTQDYLRGR